jgi:hypothetical protein
MHPERARGREPARLKFTEKAGVWEERASTVWILEPGVAVHRYWIAGDFEPGTTTTLGREIDVERVSACVGSEDPRELTDCLFDGWLGDRSSSTAARSRLVVPPRRGRSARGGPSEVELCDADRGYLRDFCT